MQNLPAITATDRLSPDEARSRYGLGKDAYYSRLKSLGIKHYKDGNFHYLDAEQIARLDKLHYHLLNGGNLSNFSEENSLVAVNNSSEISRNSPASSGEKVSAAFSNFDYDLAAKLDRSAQTVAAGILAETRNRLTAEYLQNPQKISEELQEKIFLEIDPVAIDQAWAGAHLEAAIAQVLALESPS